MGTHPQNHGGTRSCRMNPQAQSVHDCSIRMEIESPNPSWYMKLWSITSLFFNIYQVVWCLLTLLFCRSRLVLQFMESSPSKDMYRKYFDKQWYVPDIYIALCIMGRFFKLQGWDCINILTVVYFKKTFSSHERRTRKLRRYHWCFTDWYVQQPCSRPERCSVYAFTYRVPGDSSVTHPPIPFHRFTAHVMSSFYGITSVQTYIYSQSSASDHALLRRTVSVSRTTHALKRLSNTPL